jgi:cobalamin biosynthesis protein CobT
MEKNLTEKLYEELKKRRLFEEEEDDEDFEDDDEEETDDEDIDNEDESEEEEEDSDEVGSNDDFCEMVCNILHSRNQAHVFHLQTQSFAEHKALNDYYDGVLLLFDGIVESYQGKYGIIKNFKTFKIEQYKNGKKTISYFKRLLDIIDEKRDSVEDTYIQNQIDTVQELINSTIYKLRFLK